MLPIHRHRPFSAEPAFREYHSEMNVTVYSSGSRKASVPLSSLGLRYLVGRVEGERFSAADGFVLARDGRFYGSVYVDDGVVFVDPARGGAKNQVRVSQGVELTATYSSRTQWRSLWRVQLFRLRLKSYRTKHCSGTFS